MKKHKRFVLLAIMTLMLLNAKVYAAEKSFYYQNGTRYSVNLSPIKLYVRDKLIDNLKVEPILYDNNLLVPVREVFEDVGGYIEYSEAKKEVSILYKDKLLTLKLNSHVAYVNQKEINLDVVARNIDGKIMVPARIVGENLGFDVKWDSSKREVYFTEKHVIEEIVEEVIKHELPSKNAVVKEEVEELAQESTPKGSPAQSNETNQTTTGITVNDKSTDYLSPKDYSRTVIKGVTTPANNSAQRFTIVATTPITSLYKKLESGNRLIFDIDNSDLNVDNYTLKVNDNKYVSEVRYKNDDDGVTSITRVVFDLKSGSEFRVSYSEDRKLIFIDFEENIVNDIKFNKLASDDSVSIISSNNLKPEIFYLTNPERIVIDYPSSSVKNDLNEHVNGNFVKSYRASNYNGHNTRVVLDLKEQSRFEIKSSGNETTVIIKKPTFKNISYDSNNKRFAFKKVSGANFEIDSTVDNYNQKKYIFRFTSDMQNQFGYGSYHVSDSYIDKIDIESNGGKTQITVNEKQILAFKFSEDKDNFYLNLGTPKEMYPFVVVIDPGHGDHDPGAVHNGLREKDLNIDMANKLYDLLKNEKDIKAYMTRDADFFVTLNGRAEYGNTVGDIFISIHNNANPSSLSSKGTEVFYYPHSNDAELGFASKQMAQIMQDNIVNYLGSFDRGIKSSGFAVIKRTEIPAVLLEIGFLTNKEEAKLLADEGYRQKTAEAIYKSILDINEIYKPKR